MVLVCLRLIKKLYVGVKVLSYDLWVKLIDVSGFDFVIYCVGEI